MPQNVSCIEQYVLVHHSNSDLQSNSDSVPTCNDILEFRMVLNLDV